MGRRTGEKDRQVHASYREDRELYDIVRYDRAGKWYIEPLDKSLPRQKVSVEEAALKACDHSGIIYEGLPGGQIFDRRVSRIFAARTKCS